MANSSKPCDTCGASTSRRCTACERPRCDECFYKVDGVLIEEWEHQARSQGRCAECCYVPE